LNDWISEGSRSKKGVARSEKKRKVSEGSAKGRDKKVQRSSTHERGGSGKKEKIRIKNSLVLRG